jgi:S1-C subfamily serine protease
MSVLATLVSPAGTGSGAAATSSSTQAPPPELTSAIVEPTIVHLGLKLDYYLDTGYSGLGRIGPFTLEGSCTGTFVSSDGYISTAGHCVETAPGGTLWEDAIVKVIKSYVDDGKLTVAKANALLREAVGLWKVEGQSAGSSPTLSITVLHGTGIVGKQALEGAPAKVIEVATFDDGDVALIKVETTNAPVLLLGTDDDVNIGTPVLSVGYPQARDQFVDPTLTPSFKDGQISSKTTRQGQRVPVYETSAALSPGMSGGPTVVLDGRMIGVNSFTLLGTDGLYFISPVSLVNEQLDRAAVKNELGPVDLAYRAGLDAYFAGDYGQAISKFDEVLGLSPSNLWAQDFKLKATEAQSNSPTSTSTSTDPTVSSSSGSNTLVIVLVFVGLGVVVVLALVLVLVLRSRRRHDAPPPSVPTPP